MSSLAATRGNRIRRLSSSVFGLPYSREPCGRRILDVSCNMRSGAAEEEEDEEGRQEVERALHLDGTIPGTSDEFVKRVSSRAYDIRRHLHQTFDSSSYDGIVFLFFLLLVIVVRFSWCSFSILTLLFLLGFVVVHGNWLDCNAFPGCAIGINN